jgi:hypothetical protein
MNLDASGGGLPPAHVQDRNLGDRSFPERGSKGQSNRTKQLQNTATVDLIHTVCQYKANNERSTSPDYQVTQYPNAKSLLLDMPITSIRLQCSYMAPMQHMSRRKQTTNTISSTNGLAPYTRAVCLNTGRTERPYKLNICSGQHCITRQYLQ